MRAVWGMAQCSKGTDGEPTRVKQTVAKEVQNKPSYKRKWEDVNSAGTSRRPDSLSSDRKKRRVGSPEAQKKVNPYMRGVKIDHFKATEGELVGALQSLQLRVPPEAHKQMNTTPVTAGESTKVKQILAKDMNAEQKPSYKRKREDINPAGTIRRPDSLILDRKRRRVGSPETQKKVNPYMRGVKTDHFKVNEGELASALQSLQLRNPLELQKQMNAPPVTAGESTKVKQTLAKDMDTEQKSSYKRKWEDVNPAGTIRRPDSLSLDRKRRRVGSPETQKKVNPYPKGGWIHSRAFHQMKHKGQQFRKWRGQ